MNTQQPSHQPRPGHIVYQDSLKYNNSQLKADQVNKNEGKADDEEEEDKNKEGTKDFLFV